MMHPAQRIVTKETTVRLVKYFFPMLAAAFCIAGCDGVSRDQLLVRPSADETKASRETTRQVRAALSAVADRHGFVDITAESSVEGTVAWGVQPAGSFPIEMGVRSVDGDIIIDLRHFRPGTKDTALYRRIRSELIAELESRLDEGVMFVPEADHIGFSARPGRQA